MAILVCCRCAVGVAAPIVKTSAAPPAPAEKTKVTPRGDAEIRGRASNSQIVIRTSSQFAGAICSLTWNGKQFIDAFDHGRLLQSASNFDAGSRFSSETFNPTEGGCRRDGRGRTSTSRLLRIVTAANALKTTTRMAFWLRPGEKSGDQPARNTAALSNHLLTKRVTIGYKHLPHVIQYDVTFAVPVGERHTYAQFEALTAYMPSVFEKFWKYNPRTTALEPLSDGPGEQGRPVVFSTADGRHAMGVYSPQQPSKGYGHVGYGRFRFKAERVVKWNCVFRVRDKENGIEPGEYGYRCFVIVGDLQTVRSSMQSLHKVFHADGR